MSGKVAPKGPRALVGPTPAASTTLHSALSGPIVSASTSASVSSSPRARFAISPPVAPRIFTNSPPKSVNIPAQVRNGTRLSLNGHPPENPVILASAIFSTSPTVKGKEPEILGALIPPPPTKDTIGGEGFTRTSDIRDNNPQSNSALDPSPSHPHSPQPPQPPQPQSLPPPPPPPPPPSEPDNRDGVFGRKVRISTSLTGNGRIPPSPSKSCMFDDDDETGSPKTLIRNPAVSPTMIRRIQHFSDHDSRPPSPTPLPPNDSPSPHRSSPPPPRPPYVPPPLPQSSSASKDRTSFPHKSRAISPPRTRAASPHHSRSARSPDEASSSTSSTRHDPSRSSPASQSLTPQSSLLSTPYKSGDDPHTAPRPQTYSLPPWPPATSDFQPVRVMKVLYDPAMDKDRDGRYRALIETLRGIPGQEDRIKGKGKGKEILMRYDGQVVQGEPEPQVRDPRRVSGFKKPVSLRPGRVDFCEAKYEHDANSTGPPPPTSVLITNLSPLTPNQQIRRHFSVHGNVLSFEPQIDKENGSALGIVFVKYSTHEEAKTCVAKENGKRLGVAGGFSFGAVSGVDGEEIRVVLDGDGVKLRAVLRELEERKRRDREAKKKKEKEAKLKEANANWGVNAASSTPNPVQSTQSRPHPHPQSAPSKPTLPTNPQANGSSGQEAIAPSQPRVRKPPPAALVQARLNLLKSFSAPVSSRLTLKAQTPTHSSSSTPMRSRPLHSAHARDSSRSPSPVSRKPTKVSESTRHQEHEDILRELAKNGKDHVTIELIGNVSEDDVRQHFNGFQVDKVLRDHLGWYITFHTADTARRAEMVLNAGIRKLAHRSVTISVHPPPQVPSVSTKTSWLDSELVDEAQKMIIKELTGFLERDIVERVIGSTIRRVVALERSRKQTEKTGTGSKDGKVTEKKSLKGLSFKKERKREREEECVAETETMPKLEEEEKMGVEVDVTERPRKKLKMEVKTKRTVEEEDIESEDEEVDIGVSEPPPIVVVTEEAVKRKRVTSIDRPSVAPMKKKPKWHKEGSNDVENRARSKASRKRLQAAIVQSVLDGSDDSDLDLPDEPLHLPSGVQSSLSSRSPSPVRQLKRPPVPRAPSPPVHPIGIGLCEDDEDVYFAKVALTATDASKQEEEESCLLVPPLDENDTAPRIRKHITGSARTEGSYKITHAEKSAYVAQYVLRATATEPVPEVDAPQPQHVASSRSNRANARRRALGLEEMNQVQRAVALSKGETVASELSFKFNQLQTRKKHLRFARSPIHNWGLYAMERISRGEMVIEYVGEVIRAQVADKREKAYERQGIGSSYLFRIDEDLVVDATKKGNLGRLINHSCDPNCTAKIITIIGEKKIVIYAKQDIELGDEITYDYHFPIEQDKIPCLCGSAKCRGYLN